MEPTRVIIKKQDENKSEDLIPSISDFIPKLDSPDIKTDIKLEKIKSNSNIANNKVDAITNLILAIGEVKYKASHLNTLINEEANIEDIKSNWLVLGTVDDEGNIIKEQIELRKQEFELFIKQ